MNGGLKTRFWLFIFTQNQAQKLILKNNFVHCVYVVEKYSEEPTSTREESAPLLNWIFNSVGHFFLQRLRGVYTEL